jgi:1-piperideine-2-carboxylate/1-pyrroline-2-carboxylate reductase [NAD(P)H]
MNADETARALPYPALADAIRALLADATVRVPPRIVQPLAGGGSLFVMPASDSKLAIVKLITFVADNPARNLPAIQGDVMVFDVHDGRRMQVLHGPTVTARRTAAVSLLAAQMLAPAPHGRMLIVGAGVQGRSHLDAFVQGLGVREVRIASRTPASAAMLVAYAKTLGVQAERVNDADEALASCTLVVTCTSAQQIALNRAPRDDAFIAAVGAFTPRMAEWAPEVCRHIASAGRVVVDTRDADHEAGDLLQAGLDVAGFASLADFVGEPMPPVRSAGPVFFKSCGWAGWDLAAARCAIGE